MPLSWQTYAQPWATNTAVYAATGTVWATQGALTSQTERPARCWLFERALKPFPGRGIDTRSTVGRLRCSSCLKVLALGR